VAAAPAEGASQVGSDAALTVGGRRVGRVRNVRNVRVDRIGPAERVLGGFPLPLRAFHLLLGRCFPLTGGAHALLSLLPQLCGLRTLPFELPRPRVPPQGEYEASDEDDRDDDDDDPDPGAHSIFLLPVGPTHTVPAKSLPSGVGPPTRVKGVDDHAARRQHRLAGVTAAPSTAS